MHRTRTPRTPFSSAGLPGWGVALLGLVVGGCSKKDDIWLVEVDTTKGDGYACSSQYSTNFSGTLESGGSSEDGPVTDTSESIGSKILFYAKFVELSSGQRTLNTGDLLLPGEEKDGGKWVFRWTESESEVFTRNHEAGYLFEAIATSTDTTAIEITFDGGTGSGDMTIESASSTEQRESDTWSDEAADEIGTSGELGWSTPDSWENNAFDTEECDGANCRQSLASGCGATAPVTAVLTDMSKEEDFASLAALEQYGSFKTSSSDTWGGGGSFDSGF
jgi:hypothetical protein